MSNTNLYKGETGEWEVVIGLEIHAQVVSKSKLFSGAATAFGADPNTQVSLVDSGFPGMLPVLNRECVRQAIRTGLGLNCEINKWSRFDRKNYFYPDLPNGYQISQFYHPLVGPGKVLVDLSDGSQKEVRIHHIHLEQDAGKSIHDLSPDKSYIDLNRAGVALMELVTEPDMRSVEEAQNFVKKLRSILRYLGTCDGNMEEGSMRCDINVSVRRPGDEYGTRTETKNVNSLRFMGQAIEYEVQRQIELIESGGSVVQETRLFDPTKGETRSMRTKEESNDYRYFPDPDLLPLIVEQAEIDELRESLPELPDEKVNRYVTTFGLKPYDAQVLVMEKETTQYFEAGLTDIKNKKEGPKLYANWVTGELFGALNKESLGVTESKVSASHLASLINLITDNIISGKIAKDVFGYMWTEGGSPESIVESKGLKQVTDEDEIRTIVADVLAKNDAKVTEYKAGKDKLFGFFVGQVMKAMQGKGNPEVVNMILKRLLNDE